MTQHFADSPRARMFVFLERLLQGLAAIYYVVAALAVYLQPSLATWDNFGHYSLAFFVFGVVAWGVIWILFWILSLLFEGRHDDV